GLEPPRANEDSRAARSVCSHRVGGVLVGALRPHGVRYLLSGKATDAQRKSQRRVRSMLLALDQGTTNTKALLIDRAGTSVYQTAVATPLQVSPSGEIGQDLELLWRCTREVLRRCSEWARQNCAMIDGLCLTNQRETAAAWDRETGEPLGHAISWQCRRSSAVCDSLVHSAAKIQEVTGLPLDPLLSATKWAWMLGNEECVQKAASRRSLALGTIDSWLLFRLTGGRVHETDTTNASRTGLLNLDR